MPLHPSRRHALTAWARESGGLPPRWLDPVVDAKLHADHHTEVVGQLALADLIGTHAYDRHIRGRRLRYRRRRDQLVRRLDDLGTPAHGVSAGLHALVEHPDETAVLARAAAHGLPLSGLRAHWHDPTTRHDKASSSATPPRPNTPTAPHPTHWPERSRREPRSHTATPPPLTTHPTAATTTPPAC